jgi:hypothetical protein
MISLGETIIIGGGCYGSFYLQQLATARQREVVTWQRLLVIDRDPTCAALPLLASVPACELRVADWDDFLDHWLSPSGTERSPDDRIVPSPMMPHLMANWLVRSVQEAFPGVTVDSLPAVDPVNTPFDQLHPVDGVRYVSHADWLCPVHCIEPGKCPVIRAPRTWEMGETIATWADRNGASTTVLFTCRHVAQGVGMYPARLATDGLAAITAVIAQGGGTIAVGSVSACHGAVALIRVGVT